VRQSHHNKSATQSYMLVRNYVTDPASINMANSHLRRQYRVDITQQLQMTSGINTDRPHYPRVHSTDGRTRHTLIPEASRMDAYRGEVVDIRWLHAGFSFRCLKRSLCRQDRSSHADQIMSHSPKPEPARPHVACMTHEATAVATRRERRDAICINTGQPS